MGAWGAIIMNFFGSLFAVLTLSWQFHVHGPALALPFAVFAGVALAASYVLRRPGTGIAPGKQVERVIMWSSIGEGVGLFLAANIVTNLHRPEWLLPAMALVVGLHFLPIAIAARFRHFHLLGGALILAAIFGFLLPPPRGGELAGLGGALALWIAATLAIRRDWRAKKEAS